MFSQSQSVPFADRTVGVLAKDEELHFPGFNLMPLENKYFFLTVMERLFTNGQVSGTVFAAICERVETSCVMAAMLTSPPTLEQEGLLATLRR